MDHIKMGLNKIRWIGVDWVHLVQDMDQYQDLVNMAMNLRFRKILRISCLIE
jgi:cephalosporin hydroxylase